MKCSIVIRAFNEEQHIERLLEGLRSQTVQDVEIILVDSGSTDATAAIAAQYGARIVNIPPAEFTFGRSLNLGLAAATRDLVAIASAHVYPVYPDWLERLLEPFDDPRVALSYGKQRGGETSIFSEKQVFAHWYPDHSNLAQGHPFCNNANTAIRRTVWQINPYDETLTGLEDLAWARGALDGGYTIAYMADAEIVHLHDETPHEVANRYRREAIAFKRLYPEAHFSLYDFLRMASSNISSDLRHSLKGRVFWSSAASVFWFRIMQFWGTYQGYRQSFEWNWQLRQTFYYPHRTEATRKTAPRQIEPIRYNTSK
jgi:glycosyltransferase involved in cell wall biosynthesis